MMPIYPHLVRITVEPTPPLRISYQRGGLAVRSGGTEAVRALRDIYPPIPPTATPAARQAPL
jgi:hypothetical protein